MKHILAITLVTSILICSQSCTSDSIQEDSLVAPLPKEKATFPPPALEVDEIFKVVEQMPLFGGCVETVCSNKKLIRYIQDNLKYPDIARENGVEGKVYIQFVVERDGKISNAHIVKNIGAGCGEAALKVVNSMNNLSESWQSGKQRGKAVRVQYILPVTFRVEK